MDESVKKRIVCITGASGGIGSALACELAGPNTILILQGHGRYEELERTAQRLREKAAGVETIQANLMSESEQDKFGERVVARLDYVNPERICTVSWVNAAGFDLMTEKARALSFEEKWKRIFALDVLAAIRLSRRVGKWMTETAMIGHMDNPTSAAFNSSILFFGWDGAARGMEGETAQLYAAAKGAIGGFAKSLAQDLAPFVRVLTVSPGWIRTTWGQNVSPRFAERGRNESLLERWGKPEEVAALAAFLLSEKASFINGQNIEINGGYDYRPKLKVDNG